MTDYHMKAQLILTVANSVEESRNRRRNQMYKLKSGSIDIQSLVSKIVIDKEKEDITGLIAAAGPNRSLLNPDESKTLESMFISDGQECKESDRRGWDPDAVVPARDNEELQRKLYESYSAVIDLKENADLKYNILEARYTHLRRAYSEIEDRFQQLKAKNSTLTKSTILTGSPIQMLLRRMESHIGAGSDFTERGQGVGSFVKEYLQLRKFLSRLKCCKNCKKFLPSSSIPTLGREEEIVEVTDIVRKNKNNEEQDDSEGDEKENSEADRLAGVNTMSCFSLAERRCNLSIQNRDILESSCSTEESCEKNGLRFGKINSKRELEMKLKAKKSRFLHASSGLYCRIDHDMDHCGSLNQPGRRERERNLRQMRRSCNSPVPLPDYDDDCSYRSSPSMVSRPAVGHKTGFLSNNHPFKESVKILTSSGSKKSLDIEPRVSPHPLSKPSIQSTNIQPITNTMRCVAQQTAFSKINQQQTAVGGTQTGYTTLVQEKQHQQHLKPPQKKFASIHYDPMQEVPKLSFPKAEINLFHDSTSDSSSIIMDGAFLKHLESERYKETKIHEGQLDGGGDRDESEIEL